ARLAFAAEFQLQVLRRCEEVAASELRAEEFAYEPESFGEVVVLDHVARLVVVEEGEARALLERDRADVQVLQVRVAATSPGEREPDEGAAVEALFQGTEELFRVRVGHAPILKQRAASGRRLLNRAGATHRRAAPPPPSAFAG